MGYRYDDFTPGEVYHVYTRGVNRTNTFRNQVDFQRFTDLTLHCLPQGSIRSFSIARRFKQAIHLTKNGTGLVDLLCYCLMSNHIHLLLKENTKGGTSLYMQRLLNSYAKYFNLRYKRSGPLFTGRFKAVLVDKDEQLLHVSRYIHLNPYAAHLTNNVFSYPWSSLANYVQSKTQRLCHTDLMLEMMDETSYDGFVKNEADYARTLGDTKHLFIDYED